MKWGFIFLSVLLLLFSSFGFLKSFSGFLQKRTAQALGVPYHIFQSLPFVSESQRVKKIEQENLDLRSRIFSIEKLRAENEALSDQFKVAHPRSTLLLPARVLGAPSFVPGVSPPSYFILDKGLNDGVKKGQTVLVRNIFLGQIIDVSSDNSKASLVYNSLLSFTAKTERGAVGVVKTEDGEMTLGNVLLSDELKKDDLVYTKGDASLENGIGILPDLLVGKIVSLEKNPSALFQKGRLKTLVNLNNLSVVFIAGE